MYIIIAIYIDIVIYNDDVVVFHIRFCESKCAVRYRSLCVGRLANLVLLIGFVGFHTIDCQREKAGNVKRCVVLVNQNVLRVGVVVGWCKCLVYARC